jgi:hypothetical protein
MVIQCSYTEGIQAVLCITYPLYKNIDCYSSLICHQREWMESATYIAFTCMQHFTTFKSHRLVSLVVHLGTTGLLRASTDHADVKF